MASFHSTTAGAQVATEPHLQRIKIDIAAEGSRPENCEYNHMGGHHDVFDGCTKKCLHDCCRAIAKVYVHAIQQEGRQDGHGGPNNGGTNYIIDMSVVVVLSRSLLARLWEDD